MTFQSTKGVLCALACLLMPTLGFASDKFVATVVNVEGEGLAKVKRASGIESVAGLKMEILEGDTIRTEADALVDLALVDGTIIKIGPNSEYKVNQLRADRGLFQWAFTLTKGLIRALVEKGSSSENIKFRINTPSGTMGVRGTEFLLEHNEGNQLTSIYTLEGTVFFGAANCERSVTCVDIHQGLKSEILKGKDTPAPPAPYKMKEIYGASAGGALGPDRLPVLVGWKESRKANLHALSDKELTSLLEQASRHIQAAQDLLLERDPDTREAMHKAIKDGSFQQKMRLSEGYIRWKGLKGPDLGTPSGRVAARKFALADAILKPGKRKHGEDRETLSPEKLALSDISAARAKTQVQVAAERPSSGIQGRRSSSGASSMAGGQSIAGGESPAAGSPSFSFSRDYSLGGGDEIRNERYESEDDDEYEGNGHRYGNRDRDEDEWEEYAEQEQEEREEREDREEDRAERESEKGEDWKEGKNSPKTAAEYSSRKPGSKPARATAAKARGKKERARPKGVAVAAGQKGLPENSQGDEHRSERADDVLTSIELKNGRIATSFEKASRRDDVQRHSEKLTSPAGNEEKKIERLSRALQGEEVETEEVEPARGLTSLRESREQEGSRRYDSRQPPKECKGSGKNRQGCMSNSAL